MTKASDLGKEENQYFTDKNMYNCPFCQGRVKYQVIEQGRYDKSNEEEVFYFVVQCCGCEKKSNHLSNFHLAVENKTFILPPCGKIENAIRINGVGETTHVINDVEGKPVNTLDQAFYHHDPFRSLCLDETIPEQIRQCLAEANDCLNNGYLTGSTACLRKAIHKLLQSNQIPAKGENGQFYKFKERVVLLKAYCKDNEINVNDDAFVDLNDIQYVSSQELHDDDWEDFDSSKLQHLISVAADILHEFYVVPAERKKRKEKTADIKLGAKKNKKK